MTCNKKRFTKFSFYINLSFVIKEFINCFDVFFLAISDASLAGSIPRVLIPFLLKKLRQVPSFDPISNT